MTTSVTDAQSRLVVYDSLTARKQPLQPLVAGKLGMYVCGMTVYDYCHIGHARVMVAFDMVVRWLSQLGYDVNYVRNITDIDDKIIARAIENNEDIGTLTQRFTKAMHDDAATLGCLSPDAEPRATDHIDEMQQMIATLIEGDYAYAADNGDVYYAVDSFADYGKLSKRKLNEMQAGSRVEVENIKRNPFDFVLWKAAKAGEPQWTSPWGQGRPGWHIECSAMSTKCLGNTFDIHGGGHDLQFPHHENEIAQSEAATGCEYANNWMHVGFINVDGEKMSKSLGNFFTIREVTNKYHPETVRFFLLSSHYRSQVNFSDSALNEAHNSLSRLYNALRIAEQQKNQALEMDNELINQAYQSAAGQAFIAAMNDDFNSSAAISVLFSLASEVNKAAKAQDTDKAWQLAQQLRALSKSLNILQQPPKQFLQAVIGEKSENGLSDDAIDALIAERGDAKANKDYARADEIRLQLKEAGIELEDSSAGTTWRRA
ncbi:cysteine--tRNA ligase [uncultured Psychrobacter sp.]|uniref:cysteine--tRNA ligase n=1 Tax=uncultured Psychrobacter sp. TaxID=259303 RepID=UPI000ED52978|nr:cysteine--tRNA ligase [uncultured Psychrobacter sp.]HAM60755.1 cysteine--tRNA ligase [Psychrobacter sp.]|tara:strand:- start:882 stop:2342 length:1461 start_codon:yes stop_codon:yes gene_type:complete